MTPEAKVSKWFITKLKKIYGKRMSYIKPPSGMYSSRRGISDFVICIDGKFIAVEMKAKEGMKPTPIQQNYLDEIKAAGGVALYCAGKNDKIFEIISNNI